MNNAFLPFWHPTLTASGLLAEQTKALYTQDSQGNLLTQNEPWNKTVPAPKLHITQSIEGGVQCYFRADVSLPVRGEVSRTVRELLNKGAEEQLLFAECGRLLHTSGGTAEYCFWVPVLRRAANVRLVTLQDLNGLSTAGFEWLSEELAFLRCCWAVVENGQVAGVCRSVRVGARAEEAGVETLPGYRGRGYAQTVLASWAADVSGRGKAPLYSTSTQNHPSQRVAQKAGLLLIGIHFSAL